MDGVNDNGGKTAWPVPSWRTVRWPVGWAVLVAFLGGAGGAQAQLTVDVRITGAITRDGTYTHAPGDDHGCLALRFWFVPRAGAPAEHSPARWQINFAPNSAPPDASFRLEFPMEGPGSTPPVREATVRMTAAGRLWEGGTGMDGVSAEIHPGPDHRSGRFALRGLRVSGGGTERIDVAGSWRCPAAP